MVGNVRYCLHGVVLDIDEKVPAWPSCAAGDPSEWAVHGVARRSQLRLLRAELLEGAPPTGVEHAGDSYGKSVYRGKAPSPGRVLDLRMPDQLERLAPAAASLWDAVRDVAG